jgi:hypothetical protein
LHTIRLRRPWEKTAVGADVPQRVDVPEPIPPEPNAAALDRHDAGESSYHYRRRFNRPTSLDSASSVRLVVTGWSGKLDWLRFNQQPLPVAGDAIDIEIIDRLQRQNTIELQLTGTAGAPAALSGEVQLHIRAALSPHNPED